MTATRINGSATLYMVESDTLCCTKSVCGWTTTAAKWSVGDPCHKCVERNDLLPGTLEPRKYQVDIAANGGAGQCGCERWLMHTKPHELDVLTPDEREACSQRGTLPKCKHIECARVEARTDANFDALLRELPNQKQTV